MDDTNNGGTAQRPAAPVVTFLGAARTVTGSRFLVDTPTARVLVDCGLFQGFKELRLRNWAPFPVPPSTIDAVLLTHAHIDHVGYIPALVRDGFAGPVLCTDGTIALSRIVLPDSGRLHEEEASYAERRGYSKHHPALPLYTEDDAYVALERFREVATGRPVGVAGDVEAEWRGAGHILGACGIAVRFGDRCVFFSGDVGRPEHPVLEGPQSLPDADVIVCESTYGDREHDDERGRTAFREALQRTLGRGGTVVIPAFAVDRTEVVLHQLRLLIESGAIPRVPVFVDSPMACSALHAYRHAIAAHASGIRSDVEAQPDPFDPGDLVEARTVKESKAINSHDGPCVIVSASGMVTGGRVLHHLARRLPDPRNTVLLAGYQAPGTRGRRLLEGEHALKLLGRYVPVRAEIVDVPGFSVHADRSELLDWLLTAPRPPEEVLLVHGEPQAADALARLIAADVGWTAAVPAPMERVRLDRPPGARL